MGPKFSKQGGTIKLQISRKRVAKVLTKQG